MSRVEKKRKLIEQMVATLEQELAVIETAAKAAHEAATNEESKAEDQYDTRGLEASYLAGAQAHRAAELKQQISILRQLPLREFGPQDSVAPGAVVELGIGSRRMHYLLVSHGGGISVEFEGVKIQVITPQAPLGDELLGKKVGETVEVEAQNVVREYDVVSVW